MIAATPKRVKPATVERALADRIADYDPVYNYRGMLANARAMWKHEPTARLAFGWRLSDAALAALTAYPSDPLVEHAMVALARTADWTRVAGLLADVWTPDRIIAIDTLESEADAVAWAARADERDAELAGAAHTGSFEVDTDWPAHA